MKNTNPITQEAIKEFLEYNPLTGAFTWIKSKSKRKQAGSNAGCPAGDGYTRICFNKKLYQSHRLAALYMLGDLPKNSLDHIDGDKSNNAWSNLRAATLTENQQNRLRKNKNNKTGFLGVFIHKTSKRYIAQIRVNKKNTHLGSFATPEEASEAYKQAKRLMHPFGMI